MGILNVTPDSFYAGSRLSSLDEAVRRGMQMVSEGADILDVGGESTRPGSEPITEEEEIDRVAPVVECLVRETPVPLSVDTSKPGVADACLRLGARIVNDVSGLTDPKMLAVLVRHGAAAVIMHMRGTPKTMQKDIQYDDVVREVKQHLAERARQAQQAGVREIIIDPGIGFGKTIEHNLQLLARLEELQDTGYPILFGASRKSFLGSITGGLPPEERIEASLAAAVIAVMNGADIVRTHDVQATWRAVRVADATRRALYAEQGGNGQDYFERSPAEVPDRSVGCGAFAPARNLRRP
jgi:dihydropteroate synthase